MDVVALHPLAAGALPWRTAAGTYRLTVIVKATYALRAGDLATLVDPLPLFEDVFYDDNEGRSLRVASDYALRKPLADVYFTGSAYAPLGRPVPSLDARFALDAPEGNLFDKTITVLGERTRNTVTGGTSQPARFTQLPIRYELAFGGASSRTNPVGTGAGNNDPRLPSLVDPQDPRDTTSFGPIAPSWWPRARWLGGDPRLLRAMPTIEAGFEFGYFNAAPEDLRVRHLTSLEEVRLYALHPTIAEMRSRLPGLRAHAMLDLGFDRAAVRLVADTLWIDGDTMRACVTSRGDLEVAAELAAGRTPFRLLVTLARIHERPTWGPTITPSMLPPAPPSISPPAPMSQPHPQPHVRPSATPPDPMGYLRAPAVPLFPQMPTDVAPFAAGQIAEAPAMRPSSPPKSTEIRQADPPLAKVAPRPASRSDAPLRELKTQIRTKTKPDE